jgi:hypothetical protein
MITLQLTARQFFYIQSAIRRDRDALEEMAPWGIDDQIDEHADELSSNREVTRLLSRVEQEQVFTH